LSLTVFTQRNFVAGFLQKSEIGRFAFLRPHVGDLRATCDDHLRLLGKSVVNFLLVLIEFFSLGVTGEHLLKIGDFAATGIG